MNLRVKEAAKLTRSGLFIQLLYAVAPHGPQNGNRVSSPDSCCAGSVPSTAALAKLIANISGTWRTPFATPQLVHAKGMMRLQIPKKDFRDFLGFPPKENKWQPAGVCRLRPKAKAK
jgi:hypothetical protein